MTPQNKQRFFTDNVKPNFVYKNEPKPRVPFNKIT